MNLPCEWVIFPVDQVHLCPHAIEDSCKLHGDVACSDDEDWGIHREVVQNQGIVRCDGVLLYHPQCYQHYKECGAIMVAAVFIRLEQEFEID